EGLRDAGGEEQAAEPGDVRQEPAAAARQLGAHAPGHVRGGGGGAEEPRRDARRARGHRSVRLEEAAQVHLMKTEALKELVAGLDLQTDLWWLAMILSGFLATFLAAFGFPGAGPFFIWLAVLVRLAIVAGVSQQPFGAVFGR